MQIDSTMQGWVLECVPQPVPYDTFDEIKRVLRRAACGNHDDTVDLLALLAEALEAIEAAEDHKDCVPADEHEDCVDSSQFDDAEGACDEAHDAIQDALEALKNDDVDEAEGILRKAVR